MNNEAKIQFSVDIRGENERQSRENEQSREKVGVVKYFLVLAK